MKQTYKNLVLEYARTLDLFGPAVLSNWETHERTAALYARQLPQDAHILDIGSGGGLPGVVIAQVRPDVQVTLCERRRRRSSFLKLVVHQLGLKNAVVFAADVREYRKTVEWVSAQAVADLPQLVDLIRHTVAPTWHLLTRRSRSWYPPQELMGFHIDARREALDDQHDLVILTFQAREGA